jgi:aminoglycoside phosphotransferase (APT) family kinase protein
LLKIGTHLTEVLKAKAARELQWIKSYARPHPEGDLFRRSESQEDPSVHIDLLERYLNIVPLLVENVVFDEPALLHMDLQPRNVFIEPESRPTITAIIDWQGLKFYHYHSLHDFLALLTTISGRILLL